MATHGNHEHHFRRLAAIIGATEFAAFAFEGDDRHLVKLLHVRGDNSDNETREAAVNAFGQLCRHCAQIGNDGAIKVDQGKDARGPQYCLIALARSAERVVGAAAFIVRAADQPAANMLLGRLQRG